MPGEYDFTVAETIDGNEQYLVLSIEPSDDRAIPYFKGVWGKMSSAVQGFHEHAQDGGCPAWAAWQVYNWSKEKVVGRETYVAWSGDVMVGFVNLRSPFESKIIQGKEITYLEHIAAFPGCQTTRIWNRLLGGVGRALIAFSVYTSKQRGHDGILGFHVADEHARIWYDTLNAKYGGKLLSQELNGVPGFHQRSAESAYFETTAEGSTMFLEQYRHG